MADDGLNFGYKQPQYYIPTTRTEAIPTYDEADDRTWFGDLFKSLGKGVFSGIFNPIVETAAAGASALANAFRDEDDYVDFNKSMRDAGYNPEAVEQWFNDWMSPETQQANQAVSQATGFWDTLAAYFLHPRAIAMAVAENIPAMLPIFGVAGKSAKVAQLAGAARGLKGADLANYVRMQTMIASSIAEGGISALQTGQQIGAENLQLGKRFTEGMGYALPAGVGTGLIALFNPMEAQIMTRGLFMNSRKAAIAAGKETSLLRSTGSLFGRIAKGAAKEGLEELSQTAWEQINQNVANGKPWDDEIGVNMAQGFMLGAATGGLLGPFTGGTGKASTNTAVNSSYIQGEGNPLTVNPAEGGYNVTSKNLMTRAPQDAYTYKPDATVHNFSGPDNPSGPGGGGGVINTMGGNEAEQLTSSNGTVEGNPTTTVEGATNYGFQPESLSMDYEGPVTAEGYVPEGKRPRRTFNTASRTAIPAVVNQGGDLTMNPNRRGVTTGFLTEQDRADVDAIVAQQRAAQQAEEQRQATTITAENVQQEVTEAIDDVWWSKNANKKFNKVALADKLIGRPKSDMRLIALANRIYTLNSQTAEDPDGKTIPVNTVNDIIDTIDRTRQSGGSIIDALRKLKQNAKNTREAALYDGLRMVLAQSAQQNQGQAQGQTQGQGEVAPMVSNGEEIAEANGENNSEEAPPPPPKTPTTPSGWARAMLKEIDQYIAQLKSGEKEDPSLTSTKVKWQKAANHARMLLKNGRHELAYKYLAERWMNEDPLGLLPKKPKTVKAKKVGRPKGESRKRKRRRKNANTMKRNTPARLLLAEQIRQLEAKGETEKTNADLAEKKAQLKQLDKANYIGVGNTLELANDRSKVRAKGTTYRLYFFEDERRNHAKRKISKADEDELRRRYDHLENFIAGKTNTLPAALGSWNLGKSLAARAKNLMYELRRQRRGVPNSDYLNFGPRVSSAIRRIVEIMGQGDVVRAERKVRSYSFRGPVLDALENLNDEIDRIINKEGGMSEKDQAKLQRLKKLKDSIDTKVQADSTEDFKWEDAYKKLRFGSDGNFVEGNYRFYGERYYTDESGKTESLGTYDEEGNLITSDEASYSKEEGSKEPTTTNETEELDFGAIDENDEGGRWLKEHPDGLLDPQEMRDAQATNKEMPVKYVVLDGYGTAVTKVGEYLEKTHGNVDTENSKQQLKKWTKVVRDVSKLIKQNPPDWYAALKILQDAGAVEENPAIAESSPIGRALVGEKENSKFSIATAVAVADALPEDAAQLDYGGITNNNQLTKIVRSIETLWNNQAFNEDSRYNKHLDKLFGALEKYWYDRLKGAKTAKEIGWGEFIGLGGSEINVMSVGDIIRDNTEDNKQAKRAVIYALSKFKSLGYPLRHNVFGIVVDPDIGTDAKHRRTGKSLKTTEAYFDVRPAANGRLYGIIGLPKNGNQTVKFHPGSIVHELAHAKDRTQSNVYKNGKLIEKKQFFPSEYSHDIWFDYDQLTEGGAWGAGGEALQEFWDEMIKPENFILLEQVGYPIGTMLDEEQLKASAKANNITFAEAVNKEARRLSSELHAQLISGYLTIPQFRAKVDEVCPLTKQYIQDILKSYKKGGLNGRWRKDVREYVQPAMGVDKFNTNELGRRTDNSSTGVADKRSTPPEKSGVGRRQNRKPSDTAKTTTGRTSTAAQEQPGGIQEKIRPDIGGTSSPTARAQTTINFSFGNPVSTDLTTATPEQLSTLAEDEAKATVSEENKIVKLIRSIFPRDSESETVRWLGRHLVAVARQLDASWNKFNLKYLAPAWKLKELGKESIPSIGNLLELMENHTNLAGQWKDKVALIHDEFQHLNAAERDATEEFLFGSTWDDKWAYKPNWKDETGENILTKEQLDKITVDPEKEKQFNALSKEAQQVADKVFKHGYEYFKYARSLADALREEILEPKDARYAQQIESLNKQIKEAENLPNTQPQVIADLETDLKNARASKNEEDIKKFKNKLDYAKAKLANNDTHLEKLRNELAAATRSKLANEAELKKIKAMLAKADKETVHPYVPLKRQGAWAVVYKSNAFVKQYEELKKLRDQEDFLDEENRRHMKEVETKYNEMRKDANHYQVMFKDNARQASLLQDELEEKFGKGGKVYSFEREKASAVKGLSLADRARLNELIIDNAFNSELANIWFGSDDSAVSLASHVIDALNELYERTASETVRHGERIAREKVWGANKHIMASFMQQGHQNARTVANLKYAKEIASSLQQCRDEARTAKDNGDTRAMPLLNELEARHEATINRMLPDFSDSVIENVRAYTTMAQLLTRPAYYIQNATQPMMMTFPELAGYYGAAKSFKMLMSAYGDLHRLVREASDTSDTSMWKAGTALASAVREGKFNKDGKFDPGVKQMLERLKNTGKLDLGKETEFGQFSVTNTAGRVSASVMNRLNRLARNTEVINRYVSAVSAYQLEFEKCRKAGMSEAEARNKATEFAMDVVDRTQGDYNASSAPSVFGTKWGKLGLQFRKFQLFQYAWFSGMVGNAFSAKGVTAEERAVARRQLGYAMLTHGFFGIKGLPGAMLMFSLMGALGGADDGKDFETELREGIGDAKLADLILEGWTSFLLRLNMSGMVGAGEMLSLTPYAKKDLSEEGGLEANAVALMGPFARRLFNMGDAAATGNWSRFFDSFMPNGYVSVKNTLLESGYDNPRTHEQMLTNADFEWIDKFWRAMGFQAKPVERMWAKRNALTMADKYFNNEVRPEILDYYIKAARGDASAAKDFRKYLGKANNARLKIGLTPWDEKSFRQSLKTKIRNKEKTYKGVLAEKRNQEYARRLHNAYGS